MLVSDFHYDLPPESIAQQPLADRAGSRLLCLDRHSAGWQDRRFREFPDLLRADDLLVINNTRVFPARLYGIRSGERSRPLRPGNPAAEDFLRGQIEVLLTRQVGGDANEWECLVRPGKKIGVGEKLYFGSVGGTSGPYELEAEVIERGEFGERRIKFAPVPDFFARVERIGHVPLPPYIHRKDEARPTSVIPAGKVFPAAEVVGKANDREVDREFDRERYQTIYAQSNGSAAAPTAGLHFTPEILQRIRARGIEIAEITLHVGLGTFQPVRVEKVEDHRLHREHYEISPKTAQAINRAKTEGRRVVGVGTTTVRTLEYAAEYAAAVNAENPDVSANRGLVNPGQGDAEAFIYPGYSFRVVDALLTNFHLPQSTLLMLVCALGGKDQVMSAYRHAVEADYRFYSYGDCMFVE